MKRRLISALLVMILVVSMMPVTAFAASGREISDSCIAQIKYFEGFEEIAYWDYVQYTVGYGTRCPDDKLEEYLTVGITEEAAEALLKQELDSFENSVNRFARDNGLELTQNQFDALVSFTYNLGSAWTQGDESYLFTT